MADHEVRALSCMHSPNYALTTSAMALKSVPIILTLIMPA